MMYGGSKKKKKMMMYGGKKEMMQKGGKLRMVKDPKTGKMVPFYAADGKGKMQMGGSSFSMQGDAALKVASNLPKKASGKKPKPSPKKLENIKKIGSQKGEAVKMQMGGNLADVNMKDVREAKRTRRRGERGMAKDDAKRARAANRIKRAGERGMAKDDRQNKRASRKANRKMDAAERKMLAGKQATAQGKLKKAARKTRKVGKKLGQASKAMMGMGGKKMMYQMGGFIEPGVFDLDRD